MAEPEISEVGGVENSYKQAHSVSETMKGFGVVLISNLPFHEISWRNKCNTATERRER